MGRSGHQCSLPFGITGYHLKFFHPGIRRGKRKAYRNVGHAMTGARTKCPWKEGECALALCGILRTREGLFHEMFVVKAQPRARIQTGDNEIPHFWLSFDIFAHGFHFLIPCLCLNPTPQHQPHSLCCGSSYHCLLRNLCGHLTQDSPPFSKHLPGLTCIHIRGTPWHHADERTSGPRLICVHLYSTH